MQSYIYDVTAINIYRKEPLLNLFDLLYLQSRSNSDKQKE